MVRSEEDVGGWMGMKENGRGIQFDGSSWAKKMVDLKTETSGFWLFYNLSYVSSTLGYCAIMWVTGLCGFL